jgi:hypothetical protein
MGKSKELIGYTRIDKHSCLAKVATSVIDEQGLSPALLAAVLGIYMDQWAPPPRPPYSTLVRVSCVGNGGGDWVNSRSRDMYALCVKATANLPAFLASLVV